MKKLMTIRSGLLAGFVRAIGVTFPNRSQLMPNLLPLADAAPGVEAK